MVKKGDFNQPTFADLRLVLQSSQDGTSTSSAATDSPPSKRQCTGLSLDGDVRSFCAYKVILASNSPVINEMLLKAKERRELHAMGDGLRICLEPVEYIGSAYHLLPVSQH